jgi:hypothetical protein
MRIRKLSKNVNKNRRIVLKQRTRLRNITKKNQTDLQPVITGKWISNRYQVAAVKPSSSNIETTHRDPMILNITNTNGFTFSGTNTWFRPDLGIGATEIIAGVLFLREKSWDFEIQEIGVHPEQGTSARMFGNIDAVGNMQLNYLGKSPEQGQMFSVVLRQDW